jgi:hypothetical protein
MTSPKSDRKTPSMLLALGRRDLPREIIVCGRRYGKSRVFKDDFFAVTALYEGEAGRVVLKTGRQAPFFFLPMSWIGRLLANREQAVLERLDDVSGVPRYLGRWGATGLVREYIEGRVLRKGEWVPDSFHADLSRLVATLHSRSLAVVDLEKCENVLVGADGRPHLFDFQISWYLPARRGGELWLSRTIRAWLQESDRYHLLKLQRRTRPDQMSEGQLRASYRKPWYVQFQGVLARPLTLLRRVILGYVDPRRRTGERGQVLEEQSMGMTQSWHSP